MVSACFWTYLYKATTYAPKLLGQSLPQCYFISSVITTQNHFTFSTNCEIATILWVSHTVNPTE
jgi:hypothetical protein